MESICSTLEKTKVRIVKTKDNMESLRTALNNLVCRVQRCEIVIKPADKGAITVIMDPDYYLEMCLRHLNDTNYYTRVDEDPSHSVFNRVVSFANKYKDMLTQNEYNYLLHTKYKMSNIYMLPKLHKSRRVDEIILARKEEYIHVTDEHIQLEGRPINSGPCYYTRGLSLILHEILLPCLDCIPHILKDTFDFKSRFGADCDNTPLPDNIQIATWDIKSLYTNLRHDLFMQAVEYWMETLRDHIPLLQRFSSAFVLEALHIVLKFNYVHIDNKYYHQHKGGAMGAPAMVVGSNLVVAFLEKRMFTYCHKFFPETLLIFLSGITSVT